MISLSRIRNFCIIAHIDHGKSTLADRFLQQAQVVDSRKFHNQMLDSMDIEQERGITIKSQAVYFPYTYNNDTYFFNLVDTPGHVDFSYEVSRAISSCEGALLIVDATQGIEAQTLSNFYIALEHNLHIVPVINKIDLPAADIETVALQIEHELGIEKELAIPVSAKQGIGLERLFEAIVEQVPSPTGEAKNSLRAQVFDSHYDSYLGIVLHVRVIDGILKPGMQIISMVSKKEYEIDRVGHFIIKMIACKELHAGEIGFITASIKNIGDIRVGDTITDSANPSPYQLEGYREVRPYVFSSIYPVDANDLEDLSKGIEKLSLNDASLVYEKDNSAALGTGFSCGFLGLLHLEIIQERLEREFDLSIIFTTPSVNYEVLHKNGETLQVSQADKLPPVHDIIESREPYIKAAIICPIEYIGNVMALCNDKRGIQKELHYLDTKRVEIVYEIPLADILYEFYDQLKSASKGYASFDYEIIDMRLVDLVSLEILINGDKVDAFSQLVFKGSAAQRGREICMRLKKEIPRHQFAIALQASIGSQIVSRETISAYRKDVTAKCYGGDITRKKKLLAKQKEGKKRLKMVGVWKCHKKHFYLCLKIIQRANIVQVISQ